MNRFTIYKNFVHGMVLAAFCASLVSPSWGQALPPLTPFVVSHIPPTLKAVQVDPANPLKLEFIVHPGDTRLTHDALKGESKKLIRYFLAALTVPEKDLWVNLSPYEKDRIVPDDLGVTELGRDLLAQDYLLKQMTSSFISPEHELGKKFWE